VADLRALAERSLEALLRESPWHAARIAETLAHDIVHLEIDEIALDLAARDGRPVLIDDAPPAALHIRIEERCLAALLDGAFSPLEALESGGFDAFGTPHALLRGDRLARLYLAGAARSPSHQALYEEWIDDQ
jgi:hypothetical protein